MAIATTVVTTDNGSRYLQQLCKHWSHKFQVSFDPTHGTVEMPGVTLTLDAEPASLALVLTVADEADLTRMCGVVADHIRRFAFREELVFDWAEQQTA